MARHPRHRRGDRHPGRGRLHRSPRHRGPVARRRGPPSRPRPAEATTATTATRSRSCWQCQTTAPRCEQAPPESSSPCAPSRRASAGPAPRRTKHGSRPCSATSKPNGPTSRRSPTPTRCEQSSTSPDTTTTPACGLHASLGYVTPDDEHQGRGERIRQARRDGLNRVRLTRIAYHRNNKPNHTMNTPAHCGAIKRPKTDIYSEAPYPCARPGQSRRRLQPAGRSRQHRAPRRARTALDTTAMGPRLSP